MTTSYTITRDGLFADALTLLGVIGEGQLPDSAQISICARACNLMLKQWQGEGLMLWVAQDRIVKMLTAYQTYPIGPTAGAISGGDIISGGSGYTLPPTISFNSATGTGATAVATVAGGEVDTLTILTGGQSYGYDTTINIIPDPIDIGVAVGADAIPYIWGSYGDRPVKVIYRESFIRNLTSNFDVQLQSFARQEYRSMSAKEAQGVPNSIWYDPTLGNGTLYVYVTSSTDYEYEIHLSVQYALADILLSSDLFDIPNEWLNAVSICLADRLAPSFGRVGEVGAKIERMAADAKAIAFAFGTDEDSTFIVPDQRFLRRSFMGL